MLPISAWHSTPSCWLLHHVYTHDDVIKWKQFPRYLPFVRWNHRSPVNSPHKGQRRGALMFFFDLRLNKRLSKQSRSQLFETPSRSLWRHCNGWTVGMRDLDVMFLWQQPTSVWNVFRVVVLFYASPGVTPNMSFVCTIPKVFGPWNRLGTGLCLRLYFWSYSSICR